MVTVLLFQDAYYEGSLQTEGSTFPYLFRSRAKRRSSNGRRKRAVNICGVGNLLTASEAHQRC